jgi:hypothetical protein
MALWQLEIMMVPREKVRIDTDIDNIDISNLWMGYKIKSESIDELENTLKRTKSWSEDIIQLGELSANVIEIFYSQKNIEDITCRLDLRSIDVKILDVMLRFVDVNNLAIIVEKKVYLEPSRETLLEIIRESNAYKFIKNPQGFLEKHSIPS